jgi:hypothetical protein
MALSVGHAEGALARASAEIRDRTAPGEEDRVITRRALNRADELLGQMEELLLHGHTDVPSWCQDSATTLGRAAIIAGVGHPRLETEAGVIKLMDDVYELEERLLRRLRAQTVRVAGRAVRC